MSSAFRRACDIESKARGVLLPFLREQAKDGQLVLFERSPLAAHLQEFAGDLAYNRSSDGAFVSVEIKAEESERWGNFFLETWSNRNLNDPLNHERIGSNPGWMFKLRATLLFYYFVEQDALYVINTFRLKRWAFSPGPNGAWRVNDFSEKAQAKYTQRNDTWGWCVPISVIEREVGFKKLFPRQIDLFPEAA